MGMQKVEGLSDRRASEDGEAQRKRANERQTRRQRVLEHRACLSCLTKRMMHQRPRRQDEQSVRTGSAQQLASD